MTLIFPLIVSTFEYTGSQVASVSATFTFTEKKIMIKISGRKIDTVYIILFYSRETRLFIA